MIKQDTGIHVRFIRTVIVKTVIILVLINFAFIPTTKEDLGKFSLYNHLFPGRERFPFGETPGRAYNLSLDNLEAMFRSHLITGAQKSKSDYWIFVIGDSSVWGSLLTPSESLPGQMNHLGLTTCDGRTVRFFNLGYPTLSLLKDLLILDRAMRHQPDMIIWMTTLEAFPIDQQTVSPMVSNNLDAVRQLAQEYHLSFDIGDGNHSGNWWQQTFVGQRRDLADLLRLQAYGVLWAATGIDQYYPENYPEAKRDFTVDDVQYHDLIGPTFPDNYLAIEVLTKSIGKADIPVLVVNEPILISTGLNSDLRYNFYYPRWAYDQYRQILTAHSQAKGWLYLDLWDLVDDKEFTNSAIHLSPQGTTMLAREIGNSILKEFCR